MLKSYWYYWHTGRRVVAVISMILTATLVGLGMVWAAGFSIWGVILAVLMDSVGFWVAVIYALVLREYLPEIFVSQIDSVILYQFVIPMIAVFILGRLITFVVAKFFEAQAQSVWLRKTAMGAIAVSVVGLGVGLWIYQEQQQAAAEAARLAAEEKALSYAKVKLQAEALAKQAIKATQETADQAIAGARHLGEVTATKAAELSTATTAVAGEVATKAAELTDSTTKAVSEAAADLSSVTSEATLKTVEQAKQLTDSALTSASEAASGAKAATGEALDKACIKIAETLGKKPEEYCNAPAVPVLDAPKP